MKILDKCMIQPFKVKFKPIGEVKMLTGRMSKISSDEQLPSAETMMDQAGNTAVSWFRTAVIEIDELFGKGYAKTHPELIAGFMQAAGYDEIAMYLRGLVNSHQRFAEELEVLASRLTESKTE